MSYVIDKHRGIHMIRATQPRLQTRPNPFRPWDPAVIGDHRVADFLMESFCRRDDKNPAYQQAILDLTTAVHDANIDAIHATSGYVTC